MTPHDRDSKRLHERVAASHGLYRLAVDHPWVYVVGIAGVLTALGLLEQLARGRYVPQAVIQSLIGGLVALGIMFAAQHRARRRLRTLPALSSRGRRVLQSRVFTYLSGMAVGGVEGVTTRRETGVDGEDITVSAALGAGDILCVRLADAPVIGITICDEAGVELVHHGIEVADVETTWHRLRHYLTKYDCPVLPSRRNAPAD